jgi:hypothetical protein
MSEAGQDQAPEPAQGEVDETLLDWFLELSLIERLRVTSRNAAFLERMREAPDDR